MKKVLILMALFIGCFTSGEAQVTWAEDIAEILYENCTSCHRDGGVGPFSLMTYDEVAPNASALDDVVLSGYMPPWTADLEYQSYAHERVLEPEEIAAIFEWANNGAPMGNIDNAPPPPVYPADGFISAPADLEVQMEPYESQATAFSDDYVCISLPLGLAQDKKLRAFEVIPGNAQIVHHCLLFVDETGDYESDFSGTCVGPTGGLIGGYTPGSVPTVFPSNGDDVNMGVTIPAGSNLVLAMHFPEGSAGEEDATKVRLYFYDDAVSIREIKTQDILQNWTFQLPANEVTAVSAEFNWVLTDYSILSVFPHMHLLGKTIKSYGITPDSDTIPFVNIPHWDFEWQQFYTFEEMLIVPAFTSMRSEGSFDNTAENPHNPNDPPINVYPGLNTSDEMFLVYFQYLNYEDGDENLNLEELTSLPSFIAERGDMISTMDVHTYPNPFVSEVNFEFEAPAGSPVSLWIYDLEGRLVEKVVDRQLLASNAAFFTWHPNPNLKAGTYCYSLRVGGVNSAGMVVKK